MVARRHERVAAMPGREGLAGLAVDRAVRRVDHPLRRAWALEQRRRRGERLGRGGIARVDDMEAGAEVQGVPGDGNDDSERVDQRVRRAAELGAGALAGQGRSDAVRMPLGAVAYIRRRAEWWK